jgi:UDP-N-acetylglucosamine diphosphorylase / glucose-1-phosphate thymidylyltransferase / UDP-N-acetylgalactosamine diphosphorylase / glucosamine-1-phosphate N-acetyltransferase / galactosamine-1-phosphate N-acetyltransferase
VTRRVVLFEDRQWRALRPLTDLLPVPALVFGASDLARRWLARAGAALLAIEARPRALAAWYHAPVRDTASVPADAEAIVLNAAALPGDWYEAALDVSGPVLWLAGERVAGARAPVSLLAPLLGRGEHFETALLALGLPTVSVNATFLSFPWHLIERNADAIAADLESVRGELRGDVHHLACLEAPERITVAERAVVSAFAVLDARNGPIVVGSGARVASHTVVTGPCVLGPGTELLGGFVSGTSFGPECRIAGEVEASLWQGYGNKRHHGFVGHSCVGEWVNLGALTTTSDLKNNYGNVRVWVDGRELDSGNPKVGSLIGAHVKTGIGSLLPTGASVGTGSNLFAGGRFAPKRTASFAWWDGETTVDHEIGRFLATARVAFGRRGRVFSPADEVACRELFDSTAGERRPMN